MIIEIYALYVKNHFLKMINVIEDVIIVENIGVQPIKYVI